MAATSTVHTPRNGWLDAYITVVALLTAGLTALVWSKQATLIAPGKLTYVCIFSVLLFVGENRVAWFRFGDGGQVSPGWAFAFSIVLMGSPIVAIAAMMLCTIVVDLRDHKAASKIIFNASQITTSLAAGALVLQVFGLTRPLTESGTPSAGFALADRKSTRLNSSHPRLSRMPSSA